MTDTLTSALLNVDCSPQGRKRQVGCSTCEGGLPSRDSGCEPGPSTCSSAITQRVVQSPAQEAA